MFSLKVKKLVLGWEKIGVGGGSDYFLVLILGDSENGEKTRVFLGIER